MRIDKLAFLLRYRMGLTAWNFPFAYVELIRSRPETEAEFFFRFLSSPVKVETVHKKVNFFELARGKETCLYIYIFFGQMSVFFPSGF